MYETFYGPVEVPKVIEMTPYVTRVYKSKATGVLLVLTVSSSTLFFFTWFIK